MKKSIALLFQPLLIILIAADIRLVPHIPNVTPIAAMALFGGYEFIKHTLKATDYDFLEGDKNQL